MHFAQTRVGWRARCTLCCADHSTRSALPLDHEAEHSSTPLPPSKSIQGFPSTFQFQANRAPNKCWLVSPPTIRFSIFYSQSIVHYIFSASSLSSFFIVKIRTNSAHILFIRFSSSDYCIAWLFRLFYMGNLIHFSSPGLQYRACCAGDAFSSDQFTFSPSLSQSL